MIFFYTANIPFRFIPPDKKAIKATANTDEFQNNEETE